MSARFVAVLLSLAAMAASAQSPAPRALPMQGVHTSGKLLAVARAPDGRVIVAGDFTHVNGVARRNLARVELDGTVDPAWNPSPDSNVRDIAVDDEGNIYVAGSFIGIGGVNQPRVAKLSPIDGAVAADWRPTVSAMSRVEIGPPGSVYISGNFTAVNGVPRARVAKLSTSNAAVDPVWAPNPDGAVNDVLYDASSGRVYLAGGFGQVSGVARSRLARVHAETGAPDAWAPAPNAPVYGLALGDEFKLYAIGDFTAIGGAARSTVARLSIFDGTADAFSVTADGLIADMRYGNGKLYLGGSFASINGTPRRYLARIDAASRTLDADFTPDVADPAYDIDLPGDGRLYAGYYQRFSGDEVRAGAVVFDAGSGALLEPLDVTKPGSVYKIAPALDGGMIVTGNFLIAEGERRRHAFKLGLDGRADPDWRPALTHPPQWLGIDPVSGQVYLDARTANDNGTAVRVDPLTGASDGWVPQVPSFARFAIGPDGSVYGTELGISRNVFKLSPVDGSVDALFRCAANDSIGRLAVGPDGKVYVSGSFTTIGGLPRARLARLSPINGQADPAWAPGLSSGYLNDIVFADGYVYIAGSFWNSANTISNLARINPDGSFAANWPANYARDTISALAVDGRGGMYVAGLVSNFPLGERALSRLRRADGVIDQAWDPFVYAYSMALDAYGDVVIGGTFTNIGPYPRLGLAVIPGQADPPERVFRSGFEVR